MVGVSVTPLSSFRHESKKILKTASTIDAELKVSDGVGAPRGPQTRRTAETTSNKRLESTFVLQQFALSFAPGTGSYHTRSAPEGL